MRIVRLFDGRVASVMFVQSRFVISGYMDVNVSDINGPVRAPLTLTEMNLLPAEWGTVLKQLDLAYNSLVHPPLIT